MGHQQLLDRRPEPAGDAILLAEGIALFDESFVRDQQRFSIYLANALAQPGKQRGVGLPLDG
ncbi:MAG: hypothetical protein ACRDTG_19455 [Pseudonocardiaceae bacterium]